jgi:hypothetical protein
MHKVVDKRAQGHIGVTGYLEFNEPCVIYKASITEPVDEVVRATFFGNEGYGDTRLRRKQTTLALRTGRKVRRVHIGSNRRSCYLIEQNVLCDGDKFTKVRGDVGSLSIIHVNAVWDSAGCYAVCTGERGKK